MSLGNLFLELSFGFLNLFAKSLAYSAAPLLFLSVHCFFRAVCQHVCCRTCGVILGVLLLGDLFSLFAGIPNNMSVGMVFFTDTEKFSVLLALLGPT